MPSDWASAPLVVLLAAVTGVQVAVALALSADSPSFRKIGAFGAAALALLGLLLTLALAASLLLLVAAFVIDSASGHSPADLDQILVELHLAQYLSAGGLAMAVPLVGVLSLLNARAALAALARREDRVPRQERTQVQPHGG